MIRRTDLEESGRVGLFEGLDAELDEGRGLLEVGRASGHLFPQPPQLEVSLTAGKLHEGLLPPSQGFRQLQALGVDGRLYSNATLLHKPPHQNDDDRFDEEKIWDKKKKCQTWTCSDEHLRRWITSVALLAFSDSCWRDCVNSA